MTMMFPASWPELPGKKVVLCLGAHCDDIEIGCAGVLLRLAEQNPDMTLIWIVLCAGDETRRAESISSVANLFPDHVADLRLARFRERYLPYDQEVKEFFDQLGAEFDPSLVLCPRSADLHQDHRMVGELTWNTFRSQPVWEYEIAKYEGDLVTPNLYVPLGAAEMQRKLDHLAISFPSQSSRHWYDEQTFRSLARIRGVECRSPSGYAEGFHARKVVLS